MPVQAAVTVEEFLRTPEEQRSRLELINGEIVERPMPRAEHDFVKSRVTRRLNASVASDPRWLVCPETEFVLPGDATVIPDVAVVLTSQIHAADPDQPAQFAPIIAIEVVSSDTAERLEAKVQAYLRSGCRSVWVIYPRQQEVFIRKPNGTARILTRDQVIEDDALPGSSILVKSLFEDGA